MLYLLLAFVAGVVTLACTQLAAAQLRRARARRARRTEDRITEQLRLRGWTAPSSPSHPDWMSDYGLSRR